MSVDRCVMCGEYVPEGRMICPACKNMEPSFDTIDIKVCLNKIADISNFVALISMCPEDVVVRSSNFAVNSKSIMGLLSLNLTEPLEVEIYGNIPYKVREGMKKFIVN